jgi:hypothetical protein
VGCPNRSRTLKACERSEWPEVAQQSVWGLPQPEPGPEPEPEPEPETASCAKNNRARRLTRSTTGAAITANRSTDHLHSLQVEPEQLDALAVPALLQQSGLDWVLHDASQ